MIRMIGSLLAAIFLSGVSWVDAAPTKVTWHGHAAFEIVTPSGTVFLIDPWLNNPTNKKHLGDRDPLSTISRADYILISHGHFDHVGDAVEIAKRAGSRLVATLELGTNLAKIAGFPKDQMGFDTLMNVGGEISVAKGEVIVAMTPAIHSSGIANPQAKDGDPGIVYGGNPVGFVLKIKGGPTIYHTGDTAYFSDMDLIGEWYSPDLALINIGGHFGMEPAMAARAAASVRAKLSVPHHYGTFPVITQDPGSFVEALKKKSLPVLVMIPGQTIGFDGTRVLP